MSIADKVRGLGFRVQGLGFGVADDVSRVQGSGFGFWELLGCGRPLEQRQALPC